MVWQDLIRQRKYRESYKQRILINQGEKDKIVFIGCNQGQHRVQETVVSAGPDMYKKVNSAAEQEQFLQTFGNFYEDDISFLTMIS